MKRVLILFLVSVLMLTACTQTECDCQEQAGLNTPIGQEQALDPSTKPVINCPFNICFGERFVAHKYFTTTAVTHGLDDAVCNDPFQEQYNASSYLCFIKSAQPHTQVGQDDQGDLLWEWEVLCGCSYER